MTTTLITARRILVVCLGNHCRSPLAAAVLAHHGGGHFEVRSAGLRDKWVGKPAHPLMIRAAAELGYNLAGHRGAQLAPEQLAWADAILAMDHNILAALHNRGPDVVQRATGLYLPDEDVPDPWGHPYPAFRSCAHLIEVGVHQHLTRADAT